MPRRAGSRSLRMFRRRAASFIEVMVVVVLCSVCILPLMSYFRRETRSAGHTIARSMGLALADHLMERYKNARYKDLKDRFTTEQEITPEEPLVGWNNFDQEFRDKAKSFNFGRKVAFEEKIPAVPGNPDQPRMGILTVTVTWKDPGMPSGKVLLRKVVASFGGV